MSNKSKWLEGQVCKECKTTDVKYHAKGLCKRCYMRKWKSNNADLVAKHSRTSYENHRDSRIQRASNYYYANTDKILDRLHKKYREYSFDGNMIKALERDDFSCQNPLCKCLSNRLDVHHIDHCGIHSENPNHKLDNLVTLCASCHGGYHMGNDIVWSALKNVAGESRGIGNDYART